MGTRKVWNDGEANSTVENQRVADAAATAEERAWQLLATPEFQGSSTYDKRVFPLLHEPQDTSYNYGRSLVYPGAITGGVTILPAVYTVGATGNDTSDASEMVFSAARLTTVDLPASSFPTSVTNGRTDLVYALIQRTATTANRRIKDTTTGNVSTQTVTVYSTPTVTIDVAHGPADGTFDPPALPADSSTAWYVPLAFLTLDDGAGGPWTQGNTISRFRIFEAWPAGWIKRSRIQVTAAASLMTDVVYNPSANGRSSAGLTNQWGSNLRECAILQRKTAGSGTYAVFDNKHDWRRRYAKISIGRVVTAVGGSTSIPPETDGGSTTGKAFNETLTGFYWINSDETGTSGGTYATVLDWSVGGDTQKRLLIGVNNQTGALGFAFAGTDATESHFVVEVEASDPFKF